MFSRKNLRYHSITIANRKPNEKKKLSGESKIYGPETE